MARRPLRKSHAEGFEKHSKPQLFSHEFLGSVDETPEFHDPYSDLNLFLSQKIKKEMYHCSNSRKWSPKLQQELLHKITPEFQKRFPKYRLGVHALKKTWEKVHYFSTQIQGEKEALTQDGRLNLSFFIKQNLKSASKLQHTCHLHPYHYAHQLAVKMSECIAIVDGTKPKLDQLTRTIWLLQRHLIPNLPPEHFKSPFDEYEKIDKIIVKAILEIVAKHPEISQAELGFHVQKRLIQLRAVTDTYSLSQIKNILHALYADLCGDTTQRMEKMLEKIPYPTAKCLKSELAIHTIDHPHLSEDQVIEETLDFFQKASAAMLDFEEEDIERKIQNWTIQGEMLLRWVRLDHSSKLYREVEEKWNANECNDLHSFVSLVHKSYLEKHPTHIPFAKDVETRIWIFFKYIWYTKGFKEATPTFERYLKWQKERLRKSPLAPHEKIEKIELLSKRMLPLMPFSRTRAQTVLVTEEEQSAY